MAATAPCGKRGIEFARTAAGNQLFTYLETERIHNRLKVIIYKITKALTRLSEFLVAFGPMGLFAVALLDSTFVPLPSSADALMILLATANPRWMVLYAFLATAGSTLGCLILYFISRRAGSLAEATPLSFQTLCDHGGRVSLWPRPLRGRDLCRPRLSLPA
jgi:hypothetical protein